MDYPVVVLFVASILNAVLSYVIVRGQKGPTGVLFAGVGLVVALWSLNLALFLLSVNLAESLIFANLYYIFAASIPVVFLYFAILFSGRKKIKKIEFLFILPLLFLTLSFAIDPHVLVREIFTDSFGKNVVFNRLAYVVYIAYFVFYVAISYLYLLKDFYSLNDPEKKSQIKFIVGGTIISYVFGMIFNLFLPAFGNYKYIWLGPIFSLIMIGSIGYSIAKHHLFNIRMIIAEVVFISIVLTLLFDLSINSNNNLFQLALKLIILISVLIFGIFLIRDIYRDVTRKNTISQLVKSLATANKRLRQLERQKTEFVSIASHQLRTPLTAIKGYTSMILEGSFGKVDTRQREAVEKMFGASQRLVSLVEDLLTVSRIEQGRIQYNFSQIDLAELLNSIVTEKDEDVHEKDLLVIIETERIGKKYVMEGDEVKLKQVFSNLIDNAIKFTDHGLIKIFIADDEGRKKIRISVSDTGVGMDPNTVTTLFQDIKRDKEKDARTKGIGLYVAKEIIKAHKGKIWADSKGKNEGSTFFVELPFRQ